MLCRTSWKHEQSRNSLHQGRSSQTMSSAVSHRAFFISSIFRKDCTNCIPDRKVDHKFIQLSRFSWVVVLYNWPCTSGHPMASYNLRRLDLIMRITGRHEMLTKMFNEAYMISMEYSDYTRHMNVAPISV